MLPFFVGRFIVGIKDKLMDKVDEMIISDNLFVHLALFIMGFFLCIVLTGIIAPVAIVTIWAVSKFTFWILSFVIDLNTPMF